jgi:hypothetical protein
MALMFPRLARNFAKNGYFPTDEPTLERALNALMPSDGPMCILDPCAGEGVAIAEAAHALGREQAKAFAVEFDAERARHARGLVDHCLHADLMDTMISKQSFGLLWLNPPYGDLSKDVNGNIGYQGQGRARLEKLFYQRSLSLLQYGGVLVFIVPGYVLDAELVGWLTRHYTDLRIYRAVETQFKQVVIFGRRVRQREQAPMVVKAVRNLLLQIGQGDAEAEELPSEWPFLPYIVPASPAEPEHFFRVTMEPEQFADEVGRLQGLWPSLDTHLGAAQQSLRPPARALSHWHLALALAAGAISGLCAPRPGACSSSKVTPTRTRRSSGIHRTRRRLHRRDPHPHRQVRARHPRMGHDAWLPDTGRGADHPLIASLPDGSRLHATHRSSRPEGRRGHLQGAFPWQPKHFPRPSIRPRFFPGGTVVTWALTPGPAGPLNPVPYLHRHLMATGATSTTRQRQNDADAESGEDACSRPTRSHPACCFGSSPNGIAA